LKIVNNGEYEIRFNQKTGAMLLQGVNGHPDPKKLKYPLLMDIGIMGHCHNQCHFCYQGRINQPNMTLDNFKRIIDEVRDDVMQVALGGRGDPNKHEDFEKIIEYCNENNVVPNYTTSGKNLTDRELEISKNCGAVAVSMYNSDYTFYSLKRLMKKNIKTNIHFIFDGLSYFPIEDLLKGKDIWHGKVDLDRLNAIIFLLFKPVGAARKMTMFQAVNYQFENFYDLIRKNSNNLKFKVGMDSCLSNKIQQRMKISSFEKTFMGNCDSARYSVYVSPDMKLLPCSFGSEGVEIKSSIKNLWDNSNLFNDFRLKTDLYPTVCPIMKG